MAFVVKNDLDKFLTRLAKVSRQSHKLQERVADLVVDKGLEIAKTHTISSDVYSTGEKGSRKIIMSGAGLRYQEFGTGQMGKGTYDGTLPNDPITFISNFNGQKRIVTVPNWTYDYKQSVFRDENPTPYRGFSARQPMYKTSVELQEYIKTKLKGELKK